ncbi:hypothetical protein [Pseudonocardia sp. TRM90224]|uniref:hypothetical protein n=1 Tax=Pseudonocardia sp. TRM90224 TaxID=2812678 RepID=UPI001E2F10C4|nr:hypothetical protein [Pseudonocardia sp. TRM90224]
MGRSGWTRDPVVVAGGGALLADCVGWMVWAGFAGGQAWGSLLWVVGALAAVLTACALSLLRGHRWSGVWAAWLLALVTSMSSTPVVATTGAVVVALVAWATVRLRLADPRALRVRDAARDRLVLAAGVAGLVAAGALLVWIGVWVSQSDVLRPDFRGSFFSPQALVAMRVVPVLALAVAAVETLRGSLGWAMVGTWLVVMIGLALARGADDLAVVVPAAAVLFVLFVVAYVRLSRLAEAQQIVT